MNNPPFALRNFLLFAITILLVGSRIDSFWSDSVDLPHHFALVARLAEIWHLPNMGDASLGEMNIYPRGAHILAAVAGTVLHSYIMGIQLVTLLSIVLLWGSLIFIMLSMPKSTSGKTVIAAAILYLLNWRYLGLEMHSSEVVGNFFFSQIVAQGLAYLLLAVTLYLEKNDRLLYARYLLIIGALYLVAFVHLLPVVELLGFFIALVLLDAITLGENRRQSTLRTVLYSLLFIFCAMAVVLFHSSFAAMAKISQNDGALGIKLIDSIPCIALYSCFIAAISSSLVLRWVKLKPGVERSAFMVLKYVGLFGLAVSGICLLQIVALQLGHGSAYAVKKYIFSLNTIFILELALSPLLFSRIKFMQPASSASARTNAATASGANDRDFIYRQLLAPFLIVVCFFASIPRNQIQSVSQLVSLERQLTLLRETAVPRQDGRDTYVSGLDGQSPIMSYLFSIGVFKAARSLNAAAVISNQPFQNFSEIGTIITSEHSSMDKFPACRRFVNRSGLTLLDAECIVKELNQPQKLIDFSANFTPNQCQITGFSNAEKFGKWSDHKEASIKCRVPRINGKAAISVVLNTSAFLDHIPLQRVALSLNNVPAGEFRYDAAHPNMLLTVPLTSIKDGWMDLHLSIPDAKSPTKLGIGHDDRELGISISSIEFQ
jgi:hypothetical protein